MSKKHVTALGKQFDMDAFRAKNEKTRAVGNMNVNARGDVIDSNDQVINDNNKRVSAMYKNTIQKYGPTNKASPAKQTAIVADIPEPGPEDLDLDLPNPTK